MPDKCTGDIDSLVGLGWQMYVGFLKGTSQN